LARTVSLFEDAEKLGVNFGPVRNYVLLKKSLSGK